MQTVTAKIPEDLYKRLTALAEKVDRKKSYLVREALEEYLEDMEDYLIAASRLATLKEENLISLEEIERKYGLDG